MTLCSADSFPCMHRGFFILLKKINSSQQNSIRDYELVCDQDPREVKSLILPICSRVSRNGLFSKRFIVCFVPTNQSQSLLNTVTLNNFQGFFPFSKKDIHHLLLRLVQNTECCTFQILGQISWCIRAVLSALWQKMVFCHCSFAGPLPLGSWSLSVLEAFKSQTFGDLDWYTSCIDSTLECPGHTSR